jgi:hypothetical protein
MSIFKSDPKIRLILQAKVLLRNRQAGETHILMLILSEVGLIRSLRGEVGGQSREIEGSPHPKIGTGSVQFPLLP